MIKYFTFCFIFLFLNSCTKKTEVQKSMIDGSLSNELQSANNFQVLNFEVEKNEMPEKTNADKGKLWLESIFTCDNYNYKYCFLLEKEEQVCTKRFFEFMMDSEQIFGASNLEENEYPNAIKNYKKKWFKIYPLRTEETGEPWLFGRGQDDMLNLK